MTDFSINGYKTGGNVYELKPGVSIQEAKEKGKNDKLDQLYFKSEGKNYVLQGEGLDLTYGLNSGKVPSNQVSLVNQKIEVEIDGKKVQAVINNIEAEPQHEIKINGKTVKAEIIDVDDENNTKTEAFREAMSSKTSDITSKVVVGAIVVGAVAAGSSKGGGFCGALAVAALGAFIGTGISMGIGIHGVIKSSHQKPNPEQLKPLLEKQVFI